MSDATPVPAAPPPEPAPADRSPAAPLFCWLVIQLIALSLGALRVPLSARFAPPGEQFALHTVLVAQVLGAALLLPFLMRDLRTSSMVMLTIAPFIQLAAYLSGVPTSRAALAMAYVAIWLATLALWPAVLRTRRAAMLGVACALAMSLGGAIAWYAWAESRQAGAIDWSRDALFGPLLGAVAHVEAPSPLLAPWLVAIFLLIVSSAVHFALRKRAVGRSGRPPASA